MYRNDCLHWTFWFFYCYNLMNTTMQICGTVTIFQGYKHGNFFFNVKAISHDNFLIIFFLYRSHYCHQFCQVPETNEKKWIWTFFIMFAATNVRWLILKCTTFFFHFNRVAVLKYYNYLAEFKRHIHAIIYSKTPIHRIHSNQSVHVV